MRTKYLVGELPTGVSTTLGAVVFPECLPHAQAAKVFYRCQPVSGGFFEVQDGQVQPYGESVGLGLRARPEDAVLIARAIGLHPSCR